MKLTGQHPREQGFDRKIADTRRMTRGQERESRIWPRRPFLSRAAEALSQGQRLYNGQTGGPGASSILDASKVSAVENPNISEG